MRMAMGVLALAGALAVGSPARLAAQQVGCSGHTRADLGFNGMSFSSGMTFVTPDLTLFGTEPVLSGIDPHGPGAGKLEEGDVLAAVDGQLITTRAGAERFAGLRPGTPVVLTVRRGGRNLDVRIVPGALCQPVLPPVPAIPQAPHIAAGGKGGLGAALSCNCSIEEGPAGAERWTFREPPRVETVGADGAAERAGLRAGDHIVSVDGVAITTPEGGRRFGAIKPGQRVRLGLLRGGAHLDIVLVADER